jgi:hypothetical protein
MTSHASREEELPDAAVVVRGGRMASFEEVQASAEDQFSQSEKETGSGVYGVSVCSLPELSALEILYAIPEGKLPHGSFRETTVGKLRELGFDVVPSEWHGHATLTFSALPTEEDWRKLNFVFSDPRKNPVARRSKKGPPYGAAS